MKRLPSVFLVLKKEVTSIYQNLMTKGIKGEGNELLIRKGLLTCSHTSTHVVGILIEFTPFLIAGAALTRKSLAPAEKQIGEWLRRPSDRVKQKTK